MCRCLGNSFQIIFNWEKLPSLYQKNHPKQNLAKTTIRWERKKEINEILWIYDGGKGRAAGETYPDDKLGSRFPARYGSELVAQRGVLTTDTGR